MRITVSDAERRARIGVRHGIAPEHRFADPVAATNAMTVLHSTEPATVFLSLHQRVDALGVADIEKALYEERSLVKQLAMRRTLFVFPRDLLPAAWGGASARTHGSESRRLAKDVVRAGLSNDGEQWLQTARRRVIDLLAEHPEGLGGVRIREELPEIVGKAVAGGDATPFAHRLLTNLGASADILRGHNDLHWRLSRPRWTLTEHWLGAGAEPSTAEEGYATLVARWLATFGPGTEDDLVWWLGSTNRPYAVAEWAALLPVLDPTVMGWKERDFYLGPHREALFDSNGNAGTTAWVDGRIVGCWVQDAEGVVELRILEPVTASARSRLEAEAARLTDWLDGTRVGTVYPSSAMRATAGLMRAFLRIPRWS